MKLRFMEGGHAGRLVDIETDAFTIGRDIKCDLMLDEDGVSREHCKIFKDGGDYNIKDLGSTNGVFLNGKKVEGAVKLSSNDKIRIGKILLLFTDSAGVLDTAEVEKLQEVAKAQLAEKEAEELQKRFVEQKAKEKEAAKKGAEEKKAEAANKAVTVVFALIMAVLAGLLVFMLLAPNNTGQKPGDDNSGGGIVVTTPGDDDDDDDAAAPPPTGGDGGNNVVNGDDGNANTATGDDDDDANTATGDDDDAQPPVPEERPKITYYWIRTNPTGAVAVVNGNDVGTTPVMVQGLKPGTHQLKLIKDGYRDLERVFRVPFKGQFFDYKLELQPGVCLITSEPSGMAVMRGTQIIGYTPYLFRGASGEHELRLVGAGYSALPFTARISQVAANKQHLSLRPLTAGLRVITVPAGAWVFVDGMFVGQSEAKARGESDPVLLGDLLPGTHKVYIEFNGSQSQAKTVKLAQGMTSNLGLLIFEVDTIISTRDGKKVEGRFIRKKANGDITLALEGGKLVTIKAADIQMLQPVDRPAPPPGAAE